MEYILIIVLQFLGIGFHVMQKIIALGEQYPTKTRKEIISAFFGSDWDSLAVSGLIVILNLVTHYIIENYAYNVTSLNHYILYQFAVALILGYGGQRIIYKYLGSAEKFLDKKVGDKLQ